jgi:hypothetical protein
MPTQKLGQNNKEKKVEKQNKPETKKQSNIKKKELLVPKIIQQIEAKREKIGFDEMNIDLCANREEGLEANGYEITYRNEVAVPGGIICFRQAETKKK